MSDSKIIYEQPLSERIRTFLRLEFLFSETLHGISGESAWDSRAAVSSLLEIMALFGRGDLRQEVIKELERHLAILSRLQDSPEVDHDRLREVLVELESLSASLHGNGAFAQSLRDNEFLGTIRQRSAIPGGTCAFDLPAFHFWLNQPADQRVADLRRWMDILEPLHRALVTILQLIRKSSVPAEVTAQGGMYQKTLDRQTSCHLIRVALPADAPCFPEISGSKHRFTIRFLEQPDPGKRSIQTKQDIPFRLICCIF